MCLHYLKPALVEACSHQVARIFGVGLGSVAFALDVYLYSTMRYINRRFTYLLNYLWPC